MSEVFIIHANGTYRLEIDGRQVGPMCTERAAKGIKRWLEEGGLADIRGPAANSKLGRALEDVDRAFDTVKDLLTNGLKG
jgi:hypothetical protein